MSQASWRFSLKRSRKLQHGADTFLEETLLLLSPLQFLGADVQGGDGPFAGQEGPLVVQAMTEPLLPH